MLDDEAIKPISGTGFSIERGKNPGEFTVNITQLDQPTETAEPEAPAAA